MKKRLFILFFLTLVVPVTGVFGMVKEKKDEGIITGKKRKRVPSSNLVDLDTEFRGNGFNKRQRLSSIPSVAELRGLTEGQKKDVVEVCIFDNLAGKPLEKVIDSDLKIIGELVNLEILHIYCSSSKISGKKVTANGLRYLENLKKLKEFKIAGLGSGGMRRIISMLKQCNELEKVTFLNCWMLHNPDLMEIPHCVRTLHINGCSQITADGVLNLMHNEKLEELIVKYCKKTSPKAEWLVEQVEALWNQEDEDYFPALKKIKIGEKKKTFSYE